MLVVYSGPSLRPADLATFERRADEAGVPVRIRPPIIRGDLEKLAAEVPEATCVLLLDGEFGQRMAVSVTEIRAYLAGGGRMIGASSMGALRAAECWSLGMTGYGWVVQRYLDGTTDSDAEVALLFDAGTGQPVTVPLVNVRWLLSESVRTGVLEQAAANDALTAARGIGYRGRYPSALGRSWQRVLRPAAADVLLPQLEEDRLDDWDRKRLDALEVLDLLVRQCDVPDVTPSGLRSVGRFPTTTGGGPS
ncbi:TfuA-like protein [Paractinoplanes lichenicola]|uniref:TfuA-like core domain-containing protein n=1 Tax=Paractinoplanes lichenicola TaxID=2802976 RepID=A0ABS1VQI9_9ACTN|nr:TfuA-like protein [Actinoplanes lichenicola]MBL7256032.1 hypothetical protein [Actinoplanes lichenicola]